MEEVKRVSHLKNNKMPKQQDNNDEQTVDQHLVIERL